MYEPILPLGYEDIPDVFGEWISGMAYWRWFVTITFRDPARTLDTKAPQLQKMIRPGSDIPLKRMKNSRPGLRMADVPGTSWTKPGKSYANRA